MTAAHSHGLAASIQSVFGDFLRVVPDILQGSRFPISTPVAVYSWVVFPKIEFQEKGALMVRVPSAKAGDWP